MAHASEGATESVEAVHFSFMTDEEVRQHSFMKITNPNLLDSVERPIPGGLYDPALGPLDERSPCKSCGQRSYSCPGHCGHIDLVSPIYNPLLFNTLYKLLKASCIFCHHFMANPVKIKKCISKLELILKGDIIGARELDSDLPSLDSGIKYLGASHLKHDKWTSLEFTEAMSILNNIPKSLKRTKCERCDAEVPKIKKPTFGWLHMDRLLGAKARANVLRGSSLEGPLTDEQSLPEEEIINDTPSDKDDSDTNSQATSKKSRKSKESKVPHEYKKQIKSLSGGSLLPSEVKELIKLLWEKEAKFFSYLSDIQRQGVGAKADHSMFFLETLLVPPIKFRPPSKGGDSVMEHPHTVLLNKVLEANIALGNAHANKLEYSKIVRRWMDLQQSVNVMFDSKQAGGQKNVAQGICQLLEKKEGLFRQKMMGKRVNYACRSVISPDPYLAVNEIGIPPYFALRLTYPERVTPWNVAKLRDAIISGPEIHPGATHYIDKSSTVKLPPSRKARISTSRKLPSSRGVVIQDGKSHDNESEGKVVYRHLQDGDIVLVNRQPTLHKPSIMAHVVRVLKGEKTIRMHYANCSTYNADFDGDEMNVHFPQDEISRAEGYNILNANNQYVKPTSGEPIRALIQDHIISAVLLSKKDTFLRQDEFNQLLFSTGLSSCGSGAASKKFGNKVRVPEFETEIESLPPAIWKPVPLWTGKQVITALLNHITKGFLPFSVEKGGKIPRDFFSSGTVEEEQSRQKDEDNESTKRRKANQSDSKRRKELIDVLKTKEELDEDKLFIYKNNFVRGVIDKGQFGEYGLVHTVHELYGSNTAGLLLSAFSRLFTVFLQMHGFTCGVDDLLIMESKDKDRKRLLEKCEEFGEDVHLKFVGVKDENIDPVALQLKIEKNIRVNGEAALASLDRKMISQLNDITSKSEELKGLLSKGLYKIPSKNCISLMTISGAKGGVVNFQQISSHLGQQELEGKRVPRMVSGKTLPCFPPWDWASRSGGLIVDRFLSGLRPQEFYFHCMAGREGLVDTAVKTSRSGYLQRCLIKNLESLKVSYDYTVRDADGSIIQFHYGEDGVDVHQTSFLANFEALTVNEETLSKKCCRQVDHSNPYIMDLPSALKNKAMKYVNKSSSVQNRSPSFQGDFLKLLEHKYLSSLAQPGEPVGVLAAQSVGEPSTQMTLNTFHLAGRGEMNVTLGIPRLQEILMTAADNIKTPFMTCPLQKGRSEEDAKLVVNGLKKISVADVLESIKVTVEPFGLHKKMICRIYKLEMQRCRPDQNPEYASVSSEDWEDTLNCNFVRAIEDAITFHLSFIERVRGKGIKDFSPDPVSMALNEEGDEDVPSNKTQREEEDDDDGENDEGLEELDLDAQKRKRQGTDEMDYEDDSEGDANEENPLTGSDSENEMGGDEVEVGKDSEIGGPDAKDGPVETPLEDENLAESKSPDKKNKSKTKEKKNGNRTPVGKETDHRISVEVKKYSCVIHFKFLNEEPHILLAQIAQKTAAKVYIQRPGKTDDCQQITCKESQVIYHGENPKNREDIPLKEKEKIPALQTAGVDFLTFWDLQDVLDVRYIYSNNIHAMLRTYGVEAARETIIREVTNVFKSYGISVNIRHLTLIADFMTHTGGYRPMSRHGGIADSTSPFGKMSFETASKFIVEAAYHRELDDLEGPSSRICLGLPVKVGTGCFDLLQKTEF